MAERIVSLPASSTPDINWEEISTDLDVKFSSKQKKFLTDYVSALLLIKEGKTDDAKEIYARLDSDPSFMEFETDNEDVILYLKEQIISREDQTPSSNGK